MTVLLDTHILLWWVADNPRLRPAHRQIISRQAKTNPIRVAGISLWEIAMLSDLGRIRLHLPLREWLARAVAPPLVEVANLTPTIAAEVAALPTDFHRDPADRIIVASAKVLGATLLTEDKRIISANVVQIA